MLRFQALYTWLYPVVTTAPEFAAFVVVLPLRDSRDPPIGLIAVLAEWLCANSKALASSLLRGELSKLFLGEVGQSKLDGSLRLKTEISDVSQHGENSLFVSR